MCMYGVLSVKLCLCALGGCEGGGWVSVHNVGIHCEEMRVCVLCVRVLGGEYGCECIWGRVCRGMSGGGVCV